MSHTKLRCSVPKSQVGSFVNLKIRTGICMKMLHFGTKKSRQGDLLAFPSNRSMVVAVPDFSFILNDRYFRVHNPDNDIILLFLVVLKTVRRGEVTTRTRPNTVAIRVDFTHLNVHKL